MIVNPTCMIKRAIQCFSLFVFVACSSDSMPDTDDSLQEIQLTTGIGTITQARGSGIITNTLAADLPVSFVRIDVSEGNYPANYAGIDYLPAVIGKTGNKITFTTSQYYPTGGEYTKFIGWYPEATSTTLAETTKVRWDAANRKVHFPVIDGTTDILASSTVEGAKTPVEAKITSVTFAHVLTQISVSVFGEAADIEVWGKINSIALENKAQTCVLELPATTAASGATATATFAASTTDLSLMKMDNSGAVSDVTLSTEKTTIGYAMFAPHQSTSDALVLNISTEKGGTRDVTIDYADMNLVAGKSYEVKLQFKADGISPTATIADWKTAGNDEQPGIIEVD